jgi:hypothetical protein
MAFQWAKNPDEFSKLQALILSTDWDQTLEIIPSLLSDLDQEFRNIIGTGNNENGDPSGLCP